MLDHKVFPQNHLFNDEDDVQADGFEQVDDACVLYCERFMEFLIDLLSQLPTRRYSNRKSWSLFFFLLLFCQIFFVGFFFGDHQYIGFTLPKSTSLGLRLS